MPRITIPRFNLVENRNPTKSHEIEPKYTIFTEHIFHFRLTLNLSRLSIWDRISSISAILNKRLNLTSFDHTNGQYDRNGTIRFSESNRVEKYRPQIDHVTLNFHVSRP